MREGYPEVDTLGYGPTTPGRAGADVPPPGESRDFDRTLRGLRGGLPVFGGRFVLEKEIGRDGMGVVWLARDLKLERFVAIKFLPEAIANDDLALLDLKKETRRSLELTHPNIVRVHDWLEEDGLAGIAMEYIDGPSLSRIRIGRPSPAFQVDEVRPWLAAACAALEYAHGTARIVHRDIKPSNLMLTSSGVLKLCDFGIARSLGESLSRLTSGGRIGITSGSPPYMSPQHLLGMPPSVSDDIYSLGATFYELLTGKPPFYSGSIERQIESVVPPPMNERLRELQGEDVPAIPARWEALIAACLDKDPAKRPASAAAMFDWLGPATKGHARAAASAKTAKTARKRAAFLVVGIAVVGVAGGAWFYGSHEKAPPAPEPPPIRHPASPGSWQENNQSTRAQPDKKILLATESEIREALAAKNWTSAATSIGKLEILAPEHPGMEAFKSDLALGQQNEETFKTAVAEAEKAMAAGDLATATKDLSRAMSLAPPGDKQMDKLAEALEALRSKLRQEQRDAFAARLTEARSALERKDLATAEAAWQQARSIDPDGPGLAETRQAMDAAKEVAAAWPATLPPDGFFDLDALFSGTEYAGFKAYGKSKILEAAQRELKAAGYFPREADGLPGRSIQLAIIEWQREKFQSPATVTGRLDTATLDALGLRGRPEMEQPPPPALVGPVVAPGDAKPSRGPKAEKESHPRTPPRKTSRGSISDDEFRRKAKELENR